MAIKILTFDLLHKLELSNSRQEIPAVKWQIWQPSYDCPVSQILIESNLKREAEIDMSSVKKKKYWSFWSPNNTEI